MLIIILGEDSHIHYIYSESVDSPPDRKLYKINNNIYKMNNIIKIISA